MPRRDDVIAFFDRIADQPHSVPRIVLLDNAGIHKGDAMEKQRRRWAKKGLCLYYLPLAAIRISCSGRAGCPTRRS